MGSQDFRTERETDSPGPVPCAQIPALSMRGSVSRALPWALGAELLTTLSQL